jgi:CRISPR-associated endonuclease Csn1
VQNGAATSALRKIIEGENTYQKKDRNKHSHHAIDATILTLIPSTDKRNALLELFYKKEEAEKIEKGSKFVQTLKLNTELEKEKAKLLPKGVAKVREFIEGNILVNHVSKNQALVPAKKRKRIRGKIVPLLDADGKVIFERDENGNIKTDKLGRPIPQAKQWITGDCIRGELHGGTFYGAITQNKTDKVIYVVRRELKHKANAQDSGFKDWNDLEKVIVDKDLFKIMKSQFPEGTDFKTAVAEGIYMLNNKGEKVNKIRHVRCIVPSVKNPLEIKKQTYKLKKEYKNKYYAAVGDLCAMSKYESEDKKKSKYIVWNLFGIITNRKTMNEDIPLIQNNLKLDHTLVKGDMLLVYDKNPQELYDMDKNQLQQRLYVISRFEGDGRIQLLKTINAEKEPKTESIKDFNKLPEKIRQSANGINYLIKGRDFDLVNGEIVFFNKNK